VDATRLSVKATIIGASNRRSPCLHLNQSPVVLVIQTYAFYNRNRVILGTLGFLGLAIIVQGAVSACR
jgi:hypothetical protein